MPLAAPLALGALPRARSAGATLPSRRKRLQSQGRCRRVEAKAAGAVPVPPVGWKGEKLLHSSLPLLPSGASVVCLPVLSE